MLKKIISLNVNGKIKEVSVRPHWTLLYVLREELGLTGTKYGCGTGECGACTVLIDGKAVHSCLVLAAQAEGKSIITIESLSDGAKLHPIQEAFLKHGAVQCGFCTPGMILTAKAFLDDYQGGIPTEKEIKEALAGNICRCTGYVKIIEAVMTAAKMMKNGE
jgi:carbon-monoxide dehydrogenase small subunit